MGRLGEPKPFNFLRIFTIFEKSQFSIKKVILGRLGAILEPLERDLGASWAELGRMWARKKGPRSRPRRGQEAPKTRPKSPHNLRRFLRRFWSDLEPILDRGGRIGFEVRRQRRGPPQVFTVGKDSIFHRKIKIILSYSNKATCDSFHTASSLGSGRIDKE